MMDGLASSRVVVVMVTTALFSIEPASTDSSSGVLNPRRPRAFDLAADAETVVGTINKNFSCDGREYGYYADQNHDCQVFHICMPVQTALGRTLDTFQFSFFCPSRTRFSQDSRTCIDEEHAYPCHRAHDLYDLNKHIGKRPSKKKRPFNPKASSVGGTHELGSSVRVKPSGDTNSSLSSAAEFSDPGNSQSLSPSRSSSTGLSPLKSHQSSGTSSMLKNGGNPVSVDSGIDAGASGRTGGGGGGGGGGQSSSFSSRSTSHPDHTFTGSSSAGINRRGPNPSKHTASPASINHFTTPGLLTPPGPQISPTVSINRKNSRPSSVKKDDHSSANFGTASSSSSRRGSSGISGSRSPAAPGSPSLATTSNITTSPVPAVRRGSNNHQINTRTLNTSGPSRVVVNKRPISSKGQNGIKSGKNRGQESFPGSAVNSIQSSSTGSRLFTPSGAHPSHSAAHGGGFEFLKLEKGMVHSQDPSSPASHALGVAPVTGTENTSLEDDRSQGSFLSTRGRKKSSSSGSTDSDSNHLTPRPSNRPSPGSSNRGPTTVSSGASRRASSSGLTPTTRQPVYPTPQPVTSSSDQSVLTTHRVSPSRQPAVPARQLVFPLRQPAPPAQETVSPLPIHRFSPDISQEEGEVHPTSTVNYEEEDDYEALVTTEAASEAERDLDEAQFSRSRSGISSSTSRGSPLARNSIAAPVTRTVTRNRGKKKFKPSLYLLQLFKWGLQSGKNTHKFTPVDKQGPSGSLGRSGDSRTNSGTKIKQGASARRRGNSKAGSKTGNATDTSWKSQSSSERFSDGVDESGSVLTVQGSSELLDSSDTTGVYASHNAKESNSSFQRSTESSRIHGATGTQRAQISTSSPESSTSGNAFGSRLASVSRTTTASAGNDGLLNPRQHNSPGRTKDSSRLRESALSTNAQESETSPKTHGHSPASDSRRPRIQGSSNTQGLTSSSRGSSASSRTTGSTASGNTQRSNTGSRAQELSLVTIRRASGVDETTGGKHRGTGREALEESEDEVTPQPNPVDEYEALDSPATTYRPETTKSPVSAQRVSDIRSRRVGSRGSSTFLSRNSIASVRIGQTRSKGRVTSSPASTTTAPVTTEQESLTTISQSNSSIPTAPALKVSASPINSRVTPAVTTTAVPVSVSPLARVRGRPRVTGSSGTQSRVQSSVQSGSQTELSSSSREDDDEESEEDVGGGERSQHSGSRKANRKSIINVRPVSRGSRKFKVASSTTQTPLRGETSQGNDQENQKQKKALDALARFSPGLTNSRLLSVRFIPNVKVKPEKNETGAKKIGATNVRAPQSLRSSRTSSSSRRGNPRNVNDTPVVTPAPVTTPLPLRNRSRVRLRPLTVRPPVKARTTEAPTPLTITRTPSQRSRFSSGRRRVVSVSKDAKNENGKTQEEVPSPTVNSNDSSSQSGSQRKRDASRDKSPGSRRKILKKVTQISSGSGLTSTSEDST